jgi:hypothetical protein
VEGVATAATPTIGGAALHAFIEARRESGEKLYGVVDAARDKELAFEGALRYGWRLQWLFGENTAAHMRDVAPYLVPITCASSYPYPESEYLDLWAAHLGRGAGILVLTSATDGAIHAHLSNLFVSADQEGSDYFFRFYDPRVLRSFLPVCDAEEAEELFGPLTTIVLESLVPQVLQAWRMSNGQAACEAGRLEPRGRVASRRGSAR